MDLEELRGQLEALRRRIDDAEVQESEGREKIAKAHALKLQLIHQLALIIPGIQEYLENIPKPEPKYPAARR